MEIKFPHFPIRSLHLNPNSIKSVDDMTHTSMTQKRRSERGSLFAPKSKHNGYDECEILDTKEKEAEVAEKSKLHKLISKFYLTKKFMLNLRNSTIYRKPKWLKDFHFNLINDWSFFSEGVNKMDSFYKNSIQIRKRLIFFWLILELLIKKLFSLKYFKDSYKVFHPTETFHVLFDILILMVTFIYMIIIPINIGFDIDVVNDQLSAFPLIEGLINKSTIVLFLLDFIMSLNTAYFDKGQLITSRKKIITHYFKSNFLRDVLSFLYFLTSTDMIVSENVGIYLTAKLFGLFYLLRIYNVSSIFSRIEEFLFLDEKRYNILCFFKLLFSVFLFSHFCACTWHYLGFFNNSEDNSWIRSLGIYNDAWWKRYLNSIYFVVVVMNTLGFGDITPKNDTEKAFCIFLIYITCTMFAYVINSIGMILQNLNKEKREFKRYMNVINGYLRQNNINLDLRIKIRNYLEYIWQEEKISNVEEAQEIINKRLSKSLKDELILNSNGVFLKNIPLLTQNFSEETLNRLSYEMKECNMTPGDIIYNLNDLDDSLYIIRKGKVELFIDTQRRNDHFTILKTLRKGDLIGDISFFKETAKETSARSISFTSLYVIKRENFINVLKKNSYDYEIFCKIKDNMNLYNNYDSVYLICNSCKEMNHDCIKCPLLHMSLSKQRVLGRYNFSKSQERNDFIRDQKKKMNAMRNFSRIKCNAYEFASLMSSSEFVGSENNLNDPSKDEIYSVCNESDEKMIFIDKVTHNEKPNYSIEKLITSEKAINNDKVIEENHTLKKNEENSKDENSLFSINSVKLERKLTKNNESDIALKQKVDSINLECFIEIMKEFEIYFPRNNAGHLIEQYNRKIFENIKRKNLLKKKGNSLWGGSKTPGLKRNQNQDISSIRTKGAPRPGLMGLEGKMQDLIEEKQMSWFKKRKKTPSNKKN